MASESAAPEALTLQTAKLLTFVAAVTEEGFHGLDPSSVLELCKKVKEKGLTFDLLDAENYRLTSICR